MKSFAHRILLGILLLTTFSGVTFAKDPPALEESFGKEAERYAAHFGVSHKKASQRLRLQKPIGLLNAALVQNERGSFAGLWIEHLPHFRIMIRSTDTHAQSRIRRYVAGTELAGLIRILPAGLSLDRLESSQGTAHYLASQVGVPVESEIDLKSNRVRLYTLDPQELESRLEQLGLELPEGVVIGRVDQLSIPTVSIYGGLALTPCTSGFSVRNSSGTRGITTAAHCSNAVSYNGTALNFILEDQEGNQDVQWHTAPGFTVTNQFYSGIDTRSCTSTWSRTYQSVGDYVCGYGKTTGYKCGNISSTTYALSYVTNAAATFIRVDNTEGTDLCESGDSGGPWFLADTAYGTHSGCPGADENDAVYMAINYVSSLGVSVLTSP
jgi:streptogrisin C